MRYVYLLQSMQEPEQFYVGSTNDLPRRLAEHNNGKGRHTGKFGPWNCIVALQFADETKASGFAVQSRRTKVSSAGDNSNNRLQRKVRR